MEVEQKQHMSTPSSEDAYPENVQISSDSGDYDMPPVVPQKPRLRQHKTVSSVTADTRRILDQFLKRSALCHSSNVNSHLEHQYAVVGDLFDEDPQPTPYQQIGSDDECGLDFFQSVAKGDNWRFNTEPDYVDCQMLVKELINAEVLRKGLHHRVHKKINSPPGNVKFSVGGGGGGPKGKGKSKVKSEHDKDGDESSSSTEDYEFPDTELMNRKKKSSFRLALERVRQSFRRQGKKTPEVSQDSGSGGKTAAAAATLSGEQRKEYPGKSEVPLPPTPVSWRPHSKLHRENSETSKAQATASGTPSEIEFGHFKPAGAPDPHVLQVPHGTLPSEEKKKKSPALWRKSEAKEKGNEDKVRENRGIFEVILRQFRKGSSKLKRKGGGHVVKQRFHSAENLAVLPPKEDEKKLVDHFARLSGRDVEYDSDFTTAHCRIDRPHSGLASRPGHHSFRHRMHIDGLIACRPHMPVPLEFEGDELQKVLLAVPVSSSESGSISVAVDHDPVDDSVDFGLAEIESALSCLTSKPFSQKSEREKDELFEKIAEQLAIIADHYNLDSPSSPPLLYAASQSKESEEKKPEDQGGLAEAKKEELVTLDTLVPHQLSQLNCVHDASDFSNSPAVAQLVKTPTYGTFKQIVSDSVGAETGWQQIAKLFRLTQSAVHLAGMGTSVAGVIKDMTIRYFEDRFASWIVGQGGWESMVEDTNTELDSELD